MFPDIKHLETGKGFWKKKLKVVNHGFAVLQKQYTNEQGPLLSIYMLDSEEKYNSW